MPIRVLCFRCGTTYLLPEMLSGRDVRCKQCQEVIPVPVVVGAPLVPAAGSAVAALLSASPAAPPMERPQPPPPPVSQPAPVRPSSPAPTSSSSLFLWVGCGLLTVGLLLVGLILLALILWVLARGRSELPRPSSEPVMVACGNEEIDVRALAVQA
jgi:hypothetical protein